MLRTPRPARPLHRSRTCGRLRGVAASGAAGRPMHTQACSSIFDLAQRLDRYAGCQPLHRFYDIGAAAARCAVAPALAAKYPSAAAEQLVVSVTNRLTGEQTWWNEARKTKPQTFKRQVDAASLDPTGGGTTCDFCAWESLTAADTWGRVELPHAVTGSNLFKCCEPGHGIVLFKQHDPLTFSPQQLSDLLDAAWLWFVASAQHAGQGGGGAALHPFLLWNCLHRSGASQYHGHAQTVLTRMPLPYQQRLWAAAQQHCSLYSGAASSGGAEECSSSGAAAAERPAADDGCSHSAAAAAAPYAQLPPFYADWLAAHDALGLLRSVQLPAAQRQPPAASTSSSGAPHAAWAFPSLAPVKDAELLVVGSHLGCPAFKAALHAAMRALVDGLGVQTFNLAVLNLDLSAAPPPWSSLWASAAAAGVPAAAPRDAGGAAGLPVVARIVGRGSLSSAASDYGTLEVFGGASIGHTDPYAVVAALDQQLAAAAQQQQQEREQPHV